MTEEAATAVAAMEEEVGKAAAAALLVAREVVAVQVVMVVEEEAMAAMVEGTAVEVVADPRTSLFDCYKPCCVDKKISQRHKQLDRKLLPPIQDGNSICP